jgi:hypothetical protein
MAQKVQVVVRTDLEHVPDRPTRHPAGIGRRTGQRGIQMPKSRLGLSRWDRTMTLVRLFITAIEPVAQLIDAISRLR